MVGAKSAATGVAVDVSTGTNEEPHNMAVGMDKGQSHREIWSEVTPDDLGQEAGAVRVPEACPGGNCKGLSLLTLWQIFFRARSLCLPSLVGYCDDQISNEPRERIGPQTWPSWSQPWRFLDWMLYGPGQASRPQVHPS